MTREKEIEIAMKDSVAETICASGWGITPQATDLLECAFIKGAEWADRNPIFSKQEFIEKACEWLKNVLYIHNEEVEDYDFDWVSCDYDSVEEFIDNFRKAMEE